MSFLSNRLPRVIEHNQLTRRLGELHAKRVTIVDLTESNPTQVGLPYPPDLLSPLASSAALRYSPAPFGLEPARRAVVAEYRRRGADINADHVVLTASTSEAYTWLFKLLCNPGEAVMVPRPSYPLFEHLAGLEGVRLEPYDLYFHGRWEIDASGFARAPSDVRAVVVVSPNNPTGSCVSPAEVAALTSACRERGWALIADEVFVDYPLDVGTEDAAFDLAASAGCLAFSLGGLSKSVGLPQLKLGWIVVGGPPAERDIALSGLEIIADSFLSVSTPVQVALPDLLTRGVGIRQAIHERLRTNLSILRSVATEWSQCDVPPVQGGWSAVIRVPATRSEEVLVLDILEREGILVYPGFFFDFRHEAFVVLSLLVEPEVLAAALPRVFRTAA